MHNNLIKERDLYKFDEDAQGNKNEGKSIKIRKGRRKRE